MENLWKSTDAGASGSPSRAPTRPDRTPTHATVVIVARDILTREPGLACHLADYTEAVKCACARLHLTYDSESVRKATDAVLFVQRKRARYHR